MFDIGFTKDSRQHLRALGSITERLRHQSAAGRNSIVPCEKIKSFSDLFGVIEALKGELETMMAAPVKEAQNSFDPECPLRINLKEPEANFDQAKATPKLLALPQSPFRQMARVPNYRVSGELALLDHIPPKLKLQHLAKFFGCAASPSILFEKLNRYLQTHPHNPLIELEEEILVYIDKIKEDRLRLYVGTKSDYAKISQSKGDSLCVMVVDEYQDFSRLAEIDNKYGFAAVKVLRLPGICLLDRRRKDLPKLRRPYPALYARVYLPGSLKKAALSIRTDWVAQALN